MIYEWLIIDGYNLLHQEGELAALLRTDCHLARNRLVRMAEATAQKMAAQTTIVFDGREAGADAALTGKYLEIYFSPANLSADTVIERLVCKHASPGKILVVTSDRAECDTVSSAGAHTMSSHEFLARCESDAKRKTGKRTPPGQQPKLGVSRGAIGLRRSSHRQALRRRRRRRRPGRE